MDEAERVESLAVPQSLWTHTGVAELLRLLDYENADQADAIRDAARHDGFVTRETVYELGGYSDDRMLRGYTRPVNRITRRLQERGIVANDVAPMLRPVYRGVKASGFVIPLEVVTILASESQEPAIETFDDVVDEAD